jgi:predicted flap endonuclease-1-like 5' DNA nuclease
MTIAEDMWLRGKAAQTSMMQLMAYNTAIAGTAAIQAWKLGLTAPVGFWQAMGRAGGLTAAPKPAARARPTSRPSARASAPAAAPAKPVAPASVPAPAAPVPEAAAAPAPARPKPVAARPSPVAPPKPSAKPAPAARAKAEPAQTPAPAPVPPVATKPDAGPSPHLLDAPRGGKADDLTVLSGVGEKLAAALNEFGIYHFDQIATLDAEGVAWLNEQQPGFKMIAARYKVIDQARARLAE